MTNECYGQGNVFVSADLDFRTPEQKQVNDEDSLKIEINTFVWTHAPDEMTLGKADEMACKIFELFLQAREALRSQECAAGSP
jgi:hypothetical protein